MDQPHRGRLAPDDIAESRAAFMAAIAGADPTAVAGVFAENAVLLPPSADLLRGRVAIEGFWQAGLDAGLRSVALETLELSCQEGLAYEIGTYALQLTPHGDTPITDRGKYVLVHERQADGAWKWAVEMFNPNGKDH